MHPRFLKLSFESVNSITTGAAVSCARPGTDKLRFHGRLPSGKTLKKGRYTVAITASNKTGTSKPVSLSFTITG